MLFPFLFGLQMFYNVNPFNELLNFYIEIFKEEMCF